MGSWPTSLGLEPELKSDPSSLSRAPRLALPPSLPLPSPGVRGWLHHPLQLSPAARPLPVPRANSALRIAQVSPAARRGSASSTAGSPGEKEAGRRGRGAAWARGGVSAGRRERGAVSAAEHAPGAVARDLFLTGRGKRGWPFFGHRSCVAGFMRPRWGHAAWRNSRQLLRCLLIVSLKILGHRGWGKEAVYLVV